MHDQILAGKPGVRGNATQSSIAAGYAPKAARSGASALLRRPRIEAAIATYSANADITVERVLEEIRRIAFSDLRQIAEWGGSEGVRLTRSDTLSDEAAACIAEVVDHSKSRIKRGGDQAHPEHIEILDRHVKVKLHDKQAALTTLAKPLGLLREPEEPKDHPLFPRGFFEALITGDPKPSVPGRTIERRLRALPSAGLRGATHATIRRRVDGCAASRTATRTGDVPASRVVEQTRRRSTGPRGGAQNTCGSRWSAGGSPRVRGVRVTGRGWAARP